MIIFLKMQKIQYKLEPRIMHVHHAFERNPGLCGI